ncbi:hypothetical protein ELUMI_v1c06210 [Williamsoniiplasma luminosum]|uniref:Uncharacterized protein n=1 Tax=Williamsoniiplasma luminosum TaxID=214888 RepID=A0A2K8NXH6_9MOLU|nr:hypothetical protein [Williamsoniiplasma luminosum]ATZ17343.1 hypothetical protein ELUMI_v1c06210 [Williamsoniiplasma luminosum]AVP49144.1 MAG: hypothetical protein C5T88_00915 [Williamsoniiplasma luminosum]
MKLKKIEKVTENEFKINDHQGFFLDKEELVKNLNSIKLPIIILDTEFFNRSHDKTDMKNPLYNKKNKSLVYIIQYSFAKNFKEISLRNNHQAIKSMTIKRKHNDKKYDFYTQYNHMVKSFLNMLIAKKIKTIVLAGSSNDKEIFNSWINENKALLKNKKSSLFIKDPITGLYSVNTLDVYDILGKSMSFVNKKENGEEFYDPAKLKKGSLGMETIQIPSLKKFFEYFVEVFNSSKLEDHDDIYGLSMSALKFLSLPEPNQLDFLQWNKDVKKAKVHCYNDVLKMLYLLDFWYEFGYSKNNKYLK